MNNNVRLIKNLQSTFNSIKTINILFCDVQQSFMKRVYRSEQTIKVIECVAEASKLLNLKQIITEQKKEEFGPTIEGIMKHTNESTLFYEKSRFSMVTPEQVRQMEGPFVLLGIEAHICVTQTALDILGENRDLIILADGVTSSNEIDRTVAIDNLSKMGALITTSQSFLFILLQDSKSQHFKKLLPVLKKLTNPNF